MSTLSVVITCHSEGKLVLDAVRSVQTQSAPPDEVVLVNDGSLDRATCAACRQLERAQDVRLVSLPRNVGTAAARNRGIAAARGTVLVPLDADDLLPPGALAAVRSSFGRAVDVVTGPYFVQVAPHVPTELVAPGPPTLGRLLECRRFSLASQWDLLGTTPHSKGLWERIGGYDEGMGNADLHDVDFWIRALDTQPAVVRVGKPLYIWRRYLGRNSGLVSVASWARLVRKNREIYERGGLATRAEELLLLGARHERDTAGAHAIALRLARRWPLDRRLSTILALCMPGTLLRGVSRRSLARVDRLLATARR